MKLIYSYYLLDITNKGHLFLGPRTNSGCNARRLGPRKAASSVTGFMDGMGYLGASLGLGIGYLIEKFGWIAGFYFWIFGAWFAAIMMVLIWTFKERKIEYE